jgi:hypothetical protein
MRIRESQSDQDRLGIEIIRRCRLARFRGNSCVVLYHIGEQ